MITDEGGVIEKTPAYTTKTNSQKLTAQLTLKEDQSISGNLNEVTQACSMVISMN